MPDEDTRTRARQVTDDASGTSPGPARRRGWWRRRHVLLAAFSALVLLWFGVSDGDREGPGSPAAEEPSGDGPPGDGDGWRRTMVDDFGGTELDTSMWGTYDGKPESKPITYWRSENVSVAGGALRLTAERVSARAWKTGGVSSAVFGGQTHGKWSVRMRADAADGIGYAVLLYPLGGGWPPEVDFAEDSGGPREGFRATLHYSSANRTITRRLDDVDMTQWHTVSVVLEPGRITYLVDDEPWYVQDTPHVPDVPLWLGIQQTANVASGDPEQETRSFVGNATPTTSVLEVDWVARYTPLDEVTRSASDQ